MFRDGLGESSEFSGYHPIVNLTYYITVIGITVFSTSPWFLGATFVMAWIYSILLGGRLSIRMNLILVFWIIVIMAVINVIFTHEGETVLFYLNGNRITAEALIYGLSSAVMLSSVIIWFSGFNVIMTAEKLIYLFGRIAPVLGLTLSMIFRYIPLLKDRYEEVHMGQQCLDPEAGLINRPGGKQPILKRLRQAGKNVSVLISWSLESSIENADSMEARGYGLKGRTSFHLYRFAARDTLMEIWLCILGLICIGGCVLDKTEAVFYPTYEVHPFDGVTAVTFVAFALLLTTPVILDITGELKWKRSDLTV